MVAHEEHERSRIGTDLRAADVWAEALEILDLADYCDERHDGAGTGLDLDARQILKQAVSIMRRRKLPWERDAAGGASRSHGPAAAAEPADGAGGHGEACP